MVVKSKKILIVDDEKEHGDLLEQRLGPRYEIVRAHDGQEALDSARASKPDLILSDIRMPKMDGYELLRTLKSHTETQHIPFVILSAIGDTDSIYRGKELGAADYWIKPVHLGELPDLVRRYA
jgi:PleD family two-component response regulator